MRVRDQGAWLWVLAFAPRLALFGFGVMDPQRCLRADSQGYLTLAGNLLHHFAFSEKWGAAYSPETFRPPGYPLFLSVWTACFSSPVLPAAFAQCVLGALMALMAWHWLKAAGNRTGAAIGAMVLALDPVTILHTPLILAETVFNCLLMAALIAAWKASREPRSLARAGICGAFWGLSAMVKPVSLYLPIPLCFLWRREKKAMMVFFLSAYCLPALWTVRNWHATGYASFSSVGGAGLLRYPAAAVESLTTGKSMAQLDVELRQQADREHPQGYSSDAEMSGAYGKAAAPILKAHPGLLAEIWIHGIFKVLAGTGLEMLPEWISPQASSGDAENRAHVSGRGTFRLLRQHPFLIPVWVFYMAALAGLYLLSLVGVSNLWKKNEKDQSLLLLGCVVYFLILGGSQGYYRYRMPMMPFLAACAAAAFGGI